MKIIYSSRHGHSRNVAQKFGKCYDVATNPTIDDEIILFICPTYGDQELPEDMENFIYSTSETNRSYVICELGNYYGYDDYNFGALKIIESRLTELKWSKFFKSLSLDSMPSINWNVFNCWKNGLDYAISNNIKQNKQ